MQTKDFPQINDATDEPSELDVETQFTPASIATNSPELTLAARDVLTERRRQIVTLERDADHDNDNNEVGDLAAAACCYALNAVCQMDSQIHGPATWSESEPPPMWPDNWLFTYWKPRGARRDLVRAGALILAEIDRLDRHQHRQNLTHIKHCPNCGELVSYSGQEPYCAYSDCRWNNSAIPVKPATAAQPQTWRAMDSAPKDGTMVRLLVDYSSEDACNPLEDAKLAQTIGANTDNNTGDAQGWLIAGWSWEQDCFTQGKGNPIGWLPFQYPTTPAIDQLST